MNEIKRIREENKKIAVSLMKAKPLVPVSSYTKHYDSELGKYKENLQKYKQMPSQY